MNVHPYTCVRCRVPINGERYRPKFGLVFGLAGYFLTKHRYRCEHCGLPVQAKLGSHRASILSQRVNKQQYRCEKSQHMLDPHKHATCPIDGSAGVWMPKPVKQAA